MWADREQKNEKRHEKKDRNKNKAKQTTANVSFFYWNLLHWLEFVCEPMRRVCIMTAVDVNWRTVNGQGTMKRRKRKKERETITSFHVGGWNVCRFWFDAKSRIFPFDDWIYCVRGAFLRQTLRQWFHFNAVLGSWAQRRKCHRRCHTSVVTRLLMFARSDFYDEFTANIMMTSKTRANIANEQ